MYATLYIYKRISLRQNRLHMWHIQVYSQPVLVCSFWAGCTLSPHIPHRIPSVHVCCMSSAAWEGGQGWGRQRCRHRPCRDRDFVVAASAPALKLLLTSSRESCRGTKWGHSPDCQLYRLSLIFTRDFPVAWTQSSIWSSVYKHVNDWNGKLYYPFSL